MSAPGALIRRGVSGLGAEESFYGTCQEQHRAALLLILSLGMSSVCAAVERLLPLGPSRHAGYRRARPAAFQGCALIESDRSGHIHPSAIDAFMTQLDAILEKRQEYSD
jgi:hypothetical protein